MRWTLGVCVCLGGEGLESIQHLCKYSTRLFYTFCMGGGLQVYDVGESTILPIYYYSIIDGTWWMCVYLSEIMFMLISPEFIHICLQCL